MQNPDHETMAIPTSSTFVKTERSDAQIVPESSPVGEKIGKSDAEEYQRAAKASKQLQDLRLVRNACTEHMKALSSQILTGEHGLGVLSRQLYETQLAIERREAEISRLKLLYQEQESRLRACENAIEKQ